MEIKEWSMVAFLFLNSIRDIRKRTICIVTIPCFFLGGIIIHLMRSDTNWIEALIGLLPGMVFLAISYLSREAVGIGDGLVLLIVGFYIGWEQTATVLLWGLLLCAVFSLFLIVAHRANKKTALPFIPFLMAGFLIEQFLFGG